MDRKNRKYFYIKRSIGVLNVCSFLITFTTLYLVINREVDLAAITSVFSLFFLFCLWLMTHYSNILEEGLLKKLDKKNTYLEHAAKIIRHDMHSGINTYIPRGVSSLERRLSEENIKKLKLEAPLRMLKEGLHHTQKVYKGVYEFTNLVKKNAVLEMELCDIKDILVEYLDTTSYKSQVQLEEDLPKIKVNKALFCTAVDNLIRNGLKYNDSETKIVKIYRDKNYICIEDNGRGMSQSDFDNLSKPYVRKKEQNESGSGLGLNICTSILYEHNFKIKVEKLEGGLNEFEKELERYENMYKDNDNISINSESLRKKAKDNKYMGKLFLTRGGRHKGKYFLIYKEGDNKNRLLTKGTIIKIKYK
jgi:signal transduction histidine kinase